MYNVLVVDDEPLVRLTLKNMEEWESSGFFFGYEAAHGKQALEIIQGSEQIDIVILDITMPVMDGLEMIERIQLLDQKPEILILSSHHDFPLVRQAFKLGIHDYVLKSEMEPETLLRHLQAMTKRLAETKRPASPLAPVERKYLRRQCLKELLSGQIDREIAESIQQFDIRLREDCLCAAVISIQSFGLVQQRYNEEQLHLFAENVVNSINQILDKQPYGEVLRIQEDRYALFLAFDDKASASFVRIFDILKEIEHSLKHYLDIEISYGISPLGTGFSSLSKLFREAEQQLHSESRVIKRAKRYVLEHFRDENLDLQEISDFVGITKNHLSHQFSKECHEKLRDYIHRVRIEEAKKLLLTTGMKVYEVCYEVGYKNVESFSRMFKKLTGISPNKYIR